MYKRIKAIAVCEKAYFITLTYDEEHIKEADNSLAKEWSMKHLDIYYGNDDYGTKNGRFHHHVFGNFIKKINLSKSWKYGAINVQKMTSNPKAIAKYIMRLKNHSTKINTSKIFKSQKIHNEESIQKLMQMKKDNFTEAKTTELMNQLIQNRKD